MIFKSLLLLTRCEELSEAERMPAEESPVLSFRTEYTYLDMHVRACAHTHTHTRMHAHTQTQKDLKAINQSGFCKL